jgi:hypothetical protein
VLVADDGQEGRRRDVVPHPQVSEHSVRTAGGGAVIGHAGLSFFFAASRLARASEAAQGLTAGCSGAK